MKLPGKKNTILLFSVLLLLIGCGQQKEGAAPKSVVYAAETLSFTVGGGRVEEGCRMGDDFYLLCSDGTPDEAGYGLDYTLQRIAREGGAAERLDFQPAALPENAEGGVSVQNLRAGGDGTLWVTEKQMVQRYDLPDDFDPESGEKWRYITETTVTEIHRQLDIRGRELRSLNGGEIAQTIGKERVTALLSDIDGDIFACADGTVAMLNKSGIVRFILDTPGAFVSDLMLFSDGTVGAYMFDSNSSHSYTVRRIDKAAESWGKIYPVPRSEKFWPGSGETIFNYQSGDGLYCWQEEGEEGILVLNWLDSGLNAADIADFISQGDGNLATLMIGSKTGLFSLAPTDAAAMPERTILVYASMGDLSSDTRLAILDFNQSNSKYYIAVENYGSPSASEEELAAAQARLNTEMMAGNAPDILGPGCLNIAQAANQGLLEDLWPYIEQDPDLGREGVMERPLMAEEIDGGLYHLPNSFSIITAVGAKSIVGDRLGWTAEEMQEALAAMPEGCSIYGLRNDTKNQMLQQRLFMDLNHYVDWADGNCNFDTKEFQDLLSYCNIFPENPPAGVDIYAIKEELEAVDGRQMLLSVRLESFEQLQQYQAIFGDFSFVGFPSMDGSNGSRFFISTGPSITSTCRDKEGAWAFLRQVILPKYADRPEGTSYYKTTNYRKNTYFPINKRDFDWLVQQAMTPCGFRTDEEGGKVEISKRGIKFVGGNAQEEFSVSYYALPQKLYDQFAELYDNVSYSWEWNTDILNIVTEAAGAYFAGDKSLDDTAREVQSRVSLYVNEQK